MPAVMSAMVVAHPATMFAIRSYPSIMISVSILARKGRAG